ncbi:MDR family oxidoreductase [Anaeromyxobacter oryzisoli]|uniref:MDR family oxidoreductase n=1 Tax=Anaeromyxobacter oryzisoli TaxID=2925408 RepID=UPI001F58200E|nr:MDR family oxidoreductase [Anaeromyxobacter sp. SG63]
MPQPAPGSPFRALVVREEGGSRSVRFEELTPADLPAGELTVAVRYSSLNYKDGLAVTGKGKVLRKLPMVPGIDLAGTVIESSSDAFSPGDEVLVTGWGLGEASFGGYAGLARVRSAWALPVPEGLTARRAMAVGTAGLTAALCVEALADAGVRPGGRPVVVTGAAGGVGSVAVALLAHAGFEVAASTGRPEEHALLERLGAKRIVPRADLARPMTRPLEAETWAGGVDVVGGAVLGSVLRQTAYGGAVAACGLAGGTDLPVTVLPFILRGVRLLGIDSVMVSRERRERAWSRVVRDLSADLLDALTTEIPLDDVPAWSEKILAGKVRGRVVVAVGG